MTLTCSLLAQHVNEPTADCISSSLIDLSEHVSAHADRMSPAVSRCSHMSTQMFPSNYKKTEGKAKPAPALPPARLQG